MVNQHKKEITDKLALIYEYRGTPLYIHFIELLGKIDDSYSADLRNVSPEGLGVVQGAAKQCALLRQQLINENPHDIPKL